MKQRRTYLVEDPDTFTPEQLEVIDGSLSLKGLEAVEEHRVTFNVDELPEEIRKFLEQWQELHIKWASLKPYTAIPPFSSRVTPGLHIFYEPRKTQPKVQLCDLLRSVFDPENECSFDLDAEEIATPVFHATEDPEPDAYLQYYSYLTTINQLVSLIEKKLLSEVFRSRNLHRPNPDPEDIAFGGFLTVLGPDAAPKPTRATDLEAPDWVVPQWGSTALFQLAYPIEHLEGLKERDWTVTIPLHLRYFPATSSSHTRVPVPWPVVFWACDAEQDGSGNPFDRKNLGYDSAFGEGKRFMHVPPKKSGNGTGKLVSWIDVPVLDTRAADWVEMGTIGVVIIAFLGLCWVLFGGGRGGRGQGIEEKKLKKKQ
ncbi:protease B nonderepressible form [Didymosphaeria variabile]|uniref:Protein PBN1 n=1 Tax=Didymosphaeria variabile TaxID=1932322 RepID=A0A9W9CBM7_9PLEO|nr:protease B nonderepressible form [Didymosphaeria variabile]KAJ4353874.1 protease B nonderepressible form [Didymosphaeria variabile]